MNGKRFWNISNNTKYIQEINAGRIPQETEELEKLDMANERIMTSLRTKEGLNLLDFKKDFGIDFEKLYLKLIRKLEILGLAKKNETTLTLTLEGWYQSDEIISDFFLNHQSNKGPKMFKSYIVLARPKHWVKNLFLFIPAFFAQVLFSQETILKLGFGFLALDL